MMRKVIIAFLMTLLILGGCGSNKTLAQLQEELMTVFCDSSKIPDYYASFAVCANASDAQKRNLDSYLQACDYVVEDDVSEKSAYVILLRVPDLNSVRQCVLADSAFQAEYNALESTGSSEDELQACLDAYVGNALILGGFEYTNVTINITPDAVNRDASVSLNSVDAELTKCMQSFLNYDFRPGDTDPESVLQEVPDYTGIIECNGLKDFVCSWDKKKVLVSGITVLEGNSAVTRLTEISPVNASITCAVTDTIYCIEYTVSNLSRKKPILAKNAFKLVNQDGIILENTGLHVAGLVGKAKVKAGGKKKLSCCLVGPRDAVLYWYEDGMVGARSFSLAE